MFFTIGHTQQQAIQVAANFDLARFVPSHSLHFWQRLHRLSYQTSTRHIPVLRITELKVFGSMEEKDVQD